MATISREELYALVWASPLRALAEKLGISDVGVAKICARLGVPRPAQGHWQRIALGQRVEPPGLPPLAKGQEASVSLPEAAPSRRRRTPRPGSAVPDVAVRDTLGGAHPVVSAISGMLKRQEPDRDGILAIYCDGQATLRTTVAQKDRVLRILDALLRALVARSHSVELREAGRHQHGLRLVVSDGQSALRLSIIERLVRSDHVLTAEEKSDEARTGYSWAPKFDYTASGRIAIELLKVDYSTALSKWEDKAKRQVESMLGEIVLRVETKFEALRVERLRHEEEERVRREQQRVREIEREREEHRRRLGEDLVAMAANWEKAIRLRAFLDAASAAFSKVESPEPTGRAAWLEWARTYADQLDPLSAPHRVAKELFPRS